MSGRDHLLKRKRSELTQRQQRGIHHAGHQRGHQAGGRNNSLQPARVFLLHFERLQAARPEQFRGRELRHGPHARDGVNLPVLGANQDGRLAAHPVVR